MRMQRHNALRNFLAHHARCSGAAVHIEQKTTQDVLAELGVTAEDGTRARRPLHTADDRLILANRFRVPGLNPLFLRIALRGAKNCESQG